MKRKLGFAPPKGTKMAQGTKQIPAKPFLSAASWQAYQQSHGVGQDQGSGQQQGH